MRKKEDKNSIFLVAERVNCSISTVSNVLNNKGRFSQATKEAVLKAVKELQYRPNSVGRSLRMQRTETLGLLFYPSCAQVFRNPYYAEVMEGLEEELLNAGYHLLLAGHEMSTRSSETPDFVIRGKVDGLILLGAFPSSIIRSYSELNVPTLLLDSNANWPLDSIVSDGFSAEVNMVKHLHDLGHRKILMLAYKMEDSNIDQRVKGFRAGLAQVGLPAGQETVLRDYISHDDIYPVLRKRLKSASAPTAIVANNDTLAVAMMSRLVADGFRIPEDVSIVGYDDDAMAPAAQPPLTTIRVDKAKLGRTGAQMILKRLDSPDTPVAKLMLPTELVLRQSVADLR